MKVHVSFPYLSFQCPRIALKSMYLKWSYFYLATEVTQVADSLTREFTHPRSPPEQNRNDGNSTRMRTDEQLITNM